MHDTQFQLFDDARLRGGRSDPLDRSVVEQLLARIETGDRFVDSAGFEAVHRRIASGRAWQKPVEKAPGWPGVYRVGERWVRIFSRDPLDGSCDCPDFARNALGLCKHLVAVIGAFPEVQEQGPPPALRWNPIRPLLGRGDWLTRVYATDPSRPLHPLGLRSRGRRLGRVKAWLAQLALFHEPALWTLLHQEAVALERLESDRWTAEEFEAALASLRTPLFDHQREGVRRFLERGRLLLADEMGLGKTSQAIAAAHGLLSTGRIRRAVVVTPAALKGQWLREWERFSGVPAVVVDGERSLRRALFEQTRAGALIVNYELLFRDWDCVQTFAPELVVLDEAQRIKNWKTLGARVVKQLKPPYRIALTGTPMENRIDELVSLVEWVDDQALEPKWRIGPTHLLGQGLGVVGAQRLEHLRTRIAGCVLRREKAQVLTGLPSRTDHVERVAMTNAQSAAHDWLSWPISELCRLRHERELTAEEEERLRVLVLTQRLICNALSLLNFEETAERIIQQDEPTAELLERLESAKLIAFRRLVHRRVVEERRRVVVFSQWRRMLALAEWAVGDLLGDAGLRSASFTGANRRNRDAQLVRFHDEPRTRVLFATDAGGVGLNLQRASSCLINLDLPWNPAVLEQRIARVHRHGQEAPVDVHLLVSDGIESHIAGRCAEKSALFRGIFDPRVKTVAFEDLVDPFAGSEPEVEGSAGEATVH